MDLSNLPHPKTYTIVSSKFTIKVKILFSTGKTLPKSWKSSEFYKTGTPLEYVKFFVSKNILEESKNTFPLLEEEDFRDIADKLISNILESSMIPYLIHESSGISQAEQVLNTKDPHDQKFLDFAYLIENQKIATSPVAETLKGLFPEKNHQEEISEFMETTHDNKNLYEKIAESMKSHTSISQSEVFSQLYDVDTFRSIAESLNLADSLTKYSFNDSVKNTYQDPSQIDIPLHDDEATLKATNLKITETNKLIGVVGNQLELIMNSVGSITDAATKMNANTENYRRIDKKRFEDQRSDDIKDSNRHLYTAITAFFVSTVISLIVGIWQICSSNGTETKLVNLLRTQNESLKRQIEQQDMLISELKAAKSSLSNNITTKFNKISLDIKADQKSTNSIATELVEIKNDIKTLMAPHPHSASHNEE